MTSSRRRVGTILPPLASGAYAEEGTELLEEIDAGTFE